MSRLIRRHVDIVFALVVIAVGAWAILKFAPMLRH